MAVKSDTHSDEYMPKPQGGDYSDSRSPQEKRGSAQDYTQHGSREISLESQKGDGQPDPFRNLNSK
jgi:hypothetical protein